MKNKGLIIANIILFILTIILVCINASLFIDVVTHVDTGNTGENLGQGFAKVFLLIFTLPQLILDITIMIISVILLYKKNIKFGLIGLISSIIIFLFSAISIIVIL